MPSVNNSLQLNQTITIKVLEVEAGDLTDGREFWRGLTGDKLMASYCSDSGRTGEEETLECLSFSFSPSVLILVLAESRKETRYEEKLGITKGGEGEHRKNVEKGEGKYLNFKDTL